MGVAHRIEAMLEGEHRAADEEHHRHHEAPEVHLLAASEGMLGRGGTTGHQHSPQQQRLVAGVGDRVEAFGEHGNAAGQRRHDELGHRDDRVPDQRRQHRDPRSFGCHAPTV